MVRLTRCLLPATLLLLVTASPARAQLSQYHLPIEPAILETHLDLQFQYSKFTAGFGGLGAADFNVTLVSLEGQIKLGSFELGVNVPFLVHGYTTGGDSTQFGNIMAAVKWQLFGIANKLAISLFLNSYLPTHSGDGTHAFFQFQTGAVASLHLLGFDLGGGVQTVWTILGDNLPDRGLLGIYAYGRVPILGIIAIQAAVEYFNSLHPDGDVINAFLVSPTVEVSVAWFHAGIGARIAVTDEAKFVTLGRAAFIANAGLRF